MTVQVQIENNGLGAIANLQGDVTGEDFLQATDKIYASPEMHRLRYFIYQASDLDSESLDMAMLRRIAERDKAATEKTPGFQIAIIVQSDLIQTLAEVWQGFANNNSLRSQLFNSIEEARVWLHAATIQPRLGIHTTHQFSLEQFSI